MWRRFLWAFAIAGGAALAGSLLLILLVDPLGVSPIGIVPKPGLAVADRRFCSPQVIGSGQFDSFLVGTSTIHHVDPTWADAAFGGHFATVAIHGATPYELNKMLLLIGRKAPQARRVILGIDARRWCRLESNDKYNPKVLFPDWLYDQSRINDFTSLLNLRMLRMAQQQLEITYGSRRPLTPANGYRNTLVDAKWSLALAKQNLYKKRKRKDAAAFGLDDADGVITSSKEVSNFPDLALLEQEIDALPANTELIVAVMPSHVSVLGARDRDAIAQCKRQIADLITRRRGYLLDFRIASVWTKNDENFWDENHFRVGLAHELIGRIKEGVDRRRDAEDGVYRYLAGPPPASAGGG